MMHPVGTTLFARGWFWPALVVLLLASHMTIMLFVALVVSRDPSHAVEPNYYEKGLAWDQMRASVRDPARDGITIEAVIEPPTRTLGPETVILSLADTDGNQIVPASIRVIVFHHARASDRITLDLTSDSAGRYTAASPLRREGIWQIQVSFDFDEQQYDWSQAVEYYRNGS